MKITRVVNILTILVICLISAISISAQSQPLVRIKNSSVEQRKICMYKNQTINLKAKRCFKIKKSECVNVAVSKLMKSTIKIEYRNFPKTYYYAKEIGGQKREWKGSEMGKNVCINMKTAFALRQTFPAPGGGLKMIGYTKPGEKFYQFREMGNTYLKGNTLTT